MRKLSFWFLMVFVFSLSWQSFVFVPGLGSISRIFGIGLMAVALVYILVKRNIKEPPLLVIGLSLFVLWGIVSYLWSVHPSGTLTRFVTNLQLLAMVWLIWELCESSEDYYRLMQMYVLGLFIAIYDMLSVYLTFDYGHQRITAGEFNANFIAVYLAIGMPLAWYLILKRKRDILYWFNIAYIPPAIFCLILTGSRTGFIVGVIGLFIIPLTYFKLNGAGRRTVLVFFVAVLIISVFSIQEIMPRIEHNLERIKQTQETIETGQWSGRGNIWKAGFLAFSDNALVGSGSGSFSSAIIEHHGRRMAAHNTYISVMVEGGLIGITIFIGTLILAFLPVFYFKFVDKAFYVVIFATVIFAMIPLHLETDKILWFIVALCSARGFVIFKKDGIKVLTR